MATNPWLWRSSVEVRVFSLDFCPLKKVGVLLLISSLLPLFQTSFHLTYVVLKVTNTQTAVVKICKIRMVNFWHLLDNLYREYILFNRGFSLSNYITYWKDGLEFEGAFVLFLTALHEQAKEWPRVHIFLLQACFAAIFHHSRCDKIRQKQNTRIICPKKNI